MQIHELKTIDPFYSQVESGDKTFELRYNDRDFQKGDYLLLKRYNPVNFTYSGESTLVRVKHVLQGFAGIDKDFCIMSISAPIIN